MSRPGSRESAPPLRDQLLLTMRPAGLPQSRMSIYSHNMSPAGGGAIIAIGQPAVRTLAPLRQPTLLARESQIAERSAACARTYLAVHVQKWRRWKESPPRSRL